MRLWVKVRGSAAIGGAMVLTLVLLVLPGSAMTATPSPAGATIAAAAVAALVVPVMVAWGCGRGEEAAESVSIRPIAAFDFALTVLCVGGLSVAALVLYAAGVAPGGANAARAGLVFGGLVLGSKPWVDWQLAALAPTLYFLAVVLLGRGSDTNHPAWWAWIGAPPGDPSSWVLTVVVMLAGSLSYIRRLT